MKTHRNLLPRVVLTVTIKIKVIRRPR